MLHREHSAILSTVIKPALAIKTFVLSIFEWPLKTGFTVYIRMNLTASFTQLQVSLWTLGQLIESTGYVVEPYKKYPKLLEVLLEFLKTEQSTGIRREVWILKHASIKVPKKDNLANNVGSNQSLHTSVSEYCSHCLCRSRGGEFDHGRVPHFSRY